MVLATARSRVCLAGITNCQSWRHCMHESQDRGVFQMSKHKKASKLSCCNFHSNRIFPLCFFGILLCELIAVGSTQWKHHNGLLQPKHLCSIHMFQYSLNAEWVIAEWDCHHQMQVSDHKICVYGHLPQILLHMQFLPMVKTSTNTY